MNRFHQSLAVSMLALFGLWGCARGPVAPSSERTKALEEKVSKLEDELRIANASKDQYRKRMNAAEDATSLARTELQQETEKLTLAQKESDEIKAALKMRTLERDQSITQYEGFRKGIRELLAQSEANLPMKPTDSAPATLSSQLPMPRELTGEPTGPALQ